MRRIWMRGNVLMWGAVNEERKSARCEEHYLKERGVRCRGVGYVISRRLKLPVFDGLHAELEAFSEQRMAELYHNKTEKYKHRQIELRAERALDAERRKEWTKKHGHDTYGSDDSEGDEGELKLKGRKKRKQEKVCTDGKCKACGSTSHQRSNHKDCPYNKKYQKGVVSEDNKGSENSDVIDYSEDGMSDAASEDCFSSSECHSDWCFEDDIVCGNICTCGAES